MLSDDYIKENNINKDNISEKLNKYPETANFKVKNMDYVEVKNNYIYIVTGDIIENTFDGKNIIEENTKLMVLRDMDNLTMSIYPMKKDESNKIVDKVKKIDIIKNNYNTFEGTGIINKERICSIYLSDFISKVDENLEESYDLLDESMLKKYPLYRDYKNFINNNRNSITSIADKCRLTTTKNSKIYTVIDGNNNIYSFTESSVMNYKVSITMSE